MSDQGVRRSSREKKPVQKLTYDRPGGSRNKNGEGKVDEDRHTTSSRGSRRSELAKKRIDLNVKKQLAELKTAHTKLETDYQALEAKIKVTKHRIAKLTEEIAAFPEELNQYEKKTQNLKIESKALLEEELSKLELDFVYLEASVSASRESVRVQESLIKEKAELDKEEIDVDDEENAEHDLLNDVTIVEKKQEDARNRVKSWVDDVTQKKHAAFVSEGEDEVFEEPNQKKQTKLEEFVEAKEDEALTALITAVASGMKLAFPNMGERSSDKLLARQVHGNRLPSFSGKSEEWAAFLMAYEAANHACTYGDKENLVRLQRCLKGEAKKTVQSLLVGPQGVKPAIEKLKARFGRPEAIILGMIKKVRQCGNVRSDAESLVNFGLEVDNLVSTIKTLGVKDQLANPTLVHEIVEKLPMSMRMKWAQFKREKKIEFATLSEFGDWFRPITEDAFQFCPVGEESQSKAREKNDRGKFDRSKYDRGKRTDKVLVGAEAGGEKPGRKCYVCEGSHCAWECPDVVKMGVPERQATVRKLRLCFLCFAKGHTSRDCKSKRKCGVGGCKSRHHRLLHGQSSQEESRGQQRTTNEKTEEEPTGSTSSDVAKCADCGTDVNYNVVPVYAKKKDGSLMEAFVALDSYASLTASSEATMRKLGFEGRKKELIVEGFQEVSTIPGSRVYDVTIVSKLDGREATLKNVKTVPELSLSSQSVTRETLERYDHLKEVPLEVYGNQRPTFLVGIDHFELHLHREVRQGKKGEPAAVRTDMGWSLIGDNCKKKRHQAFVVTEKVQDPLHDLVKRFFSTEYVGVKAGAQAKRSKEDERAQSILDSTVKRIGQEWECGLLWGEDEVSLPQSEEYAFQRLKSMERKMDKDPEFAAEYCQRVADYVKKGYAVILSKQEAEEKNDKTFYLPHFMAYNAKKTKKYRFVFDAAAKVSGKSLNDYLIQGPDKLASLPGLLLKAREGKVCLTGDIGDMFHRVRIKKKDAKAQRFLFRGMDRDRSPDVYEMRVLFFGAKCSPTCAAAVKDVNAEEFKDEFPEAYKAIVEDHYVDDLLASVDSEEEAIALQRDVTEVHARGSFFIRNFLSNSQAVMDAIPEDLRGKVCVSLDLAKDEATERVLGMFWNPATDLFTFLSRYLKAEPEILEGRKIPTKRQVLSLAMSVFDPLGLISILTVKAKIILQQVWRKGTGWDEEIPPCTHEAWRKWLEDLRNISSFKVPRCYSVNLRTAASLQLHIFCDASQEAFGSAAYFRIEDEGCVEVVLVMGRSNVAPVKPLTIPRLELQAAVMGARLGEFIKKHHRVKPHRTVFWSDSSTVLSWIRAEGRRFKQFVGARVGEIQELTESYQWRWVPTDMNVADELTRLESPCDWSITSRWVNGPDFLLMREERWPTEVRRTEAQESEEEMVTEQAVVASERPTPVIDISRFSSWEKLIRVTARVWMIVLGQRGCNEKGSPSPNQLKHGRMYWEREVQEDSFEVEIDQFLTGKPLSKESRLKGLDLKFTGGLLRVAGRLENAEVAEDTKFPVVLDPNHPYTKLLVNHFHVAFGHNGREKIANEILQCYFIPGLKAAVKRAQYECQWCKNRRAVPQPPMMGQLPRFRVEVTHHPFVNVGLDYFGPVEVTVKRSREKRYVALFTCLTTRAVHLEIAGSLTSDSCIMALRRFFARRGCPREIHSDNGTSFHGANNELLAVLEEIDQAAVSEMCSQRGVSWKFIPPSAPHMGGSWERLVKSVKVALGDVLDQQVLREEVLATVLAEAEHSVNCHPLTHVPVDPHDEEALTPNHFLLGRSSNVQPIAEFDDSELFGRKHWKAVQVLADKFWSRWKKEYLPTLLRRHKWSETKKPVEVGDIVIECSNNHPRNAWPKAKVVKTYPGADGVVRVVDIMMGNKKIFRRPVAKLIVLDVHRESDEVKSEKVEAAE